MRYQQVGYSPDLRSLGPPAPGAPPSAEAADLVSSNVAAGLYDECEDPVSYVPRIASDGKVVGYTVRVESRVVRVMDETGVIRLLSETPSDKELRK